MLSASPGRAEHGAEGVPGEQWVLFRVQGRREVDRCVFLSLFVSYPVGGLIL